MATLRNPFLSKVLYFVLRGRPDKCPSEELCPYHLDKEEVTIKDSILLWSLKVVVPQTLRFTMLNFFHHTHIEVVRMKGLARSRVWWPGIDADIELLCSQCVSFAQHSKDPAKSPLSVWDFPSDPWQRIHIDYAGPFYGLMQLICIDAYCKYGGAEQVSSTNGFNTVRKLRKIFAMLGDPQQIVSDTGTPFTSREFVKFCNRHGIRHIRSAPYYPVTNGEAERFVQELKRALRANSDQTSYCTSQTSASTFDTECKVHRLLQNYLDFGFLHKFYAQTKYKFLKK